MPSIQFLLQFLRSSFSHFVLEGKSMPNKKALLYPGQMHLRLECLCFLSCFYFLFCFSSLPDQYLPIRRSKTFSLFSSPCCWFWLKGIGVGVGERETESIYNHKDNSFSLTRPATPERIWHLSELSSKSNSYLSGCWHRRDGAQRDLRGESESGVSGHTLQMKKWFTSSSKRTESKEPEPACPSPRPGL